MLTMRIHDRYSGLLATGSILTALFLADPVPAQTPSGGNGDYLEQVRRMTEVAAQKLEGDVRAALHGARQLARTDPAEAGVLLKQLLTTVQADTMVPQD